MNVISSIQIQSVNYILKQEHAGDKSVAIDIQKYVVTDLDALEENHVFICISLMCVITAIITHRKSITVSSALKTFVKIAQWRKPILKIFMTMKKILHVLRFINLHKILVVSRWTKNDTQAEVISCTGTLTLLAVWRQGVMGQMVGEARTSCRMC